MSFCFELVLRNEANSLTSVREHRGIQILDYAHRFMQHGVSTFVCDLDVFTKAMQLLYVFLMSVPPFVRSSFKRSRMSGGK